MTEFKIKTLSFLALTMGLLVLAVSACSGSQAASIAAIRPTWINAQISGDVVSISAAEIDKDVMTHFKISNPTATLSFMAYKYAGKTYVRADICPPCRSDSFSLVGETLVCDACGTVFDAQTGAGLRGACVAYPKASVPYQITDGNITLNGTDLVTAFQNTLRPKK
jgi:nitrite reductase/ring-hydroxylating ferredoxin subunit